MSSWVNVIKAEALAGGARCEVGRGINRGPKAEKDPVGAHADGGPDTTELVVRPLNEARAHLALTAPEIPYPYFPRCRRGLSQLSLPSRYSPASPTQDKLKGEAEVQSHAWDPDKGIRSECLNPECSPMG